MYEYNNLPYVAAYQNAFNDSVKATAAEAKLRQMRAMELLRNADLQRKLQIADYNQERNDAADTEADREINTLNPPAAQAVTTDPSDPNAEAYTRRANALRARYYLEHPNEQPGPPVPYEGGARSMPVARAGAAANNPKPDLVAQHQADMAKKQELQGLQRDADTIQRQLSAYLPNVESVTGLDAYNPKTGEHGYGGPDAKINLATGNGPQTTIAAPQFNPPTAQNPISNVDQMMERYRTYQAKKTRLTQLQGGGSSAPAGGAQPNPLSASSPAPPPTTQAGDPSMSDAYKQQARAWATANPDDPRAAQILSTLQ